MADEKDKIIDLLQNSDDKEIYSLGNLLPKVFSNFAKKLKPKLVAYFETLDDTLFDLAEKADSNQNQTLYFESMRMVRKQRGKIFSGIFSSIKSAFKSFKENEFDYFDFDHSYNQKVKSLKLSLIDESELDETLAKTNLINKSEMAYHQHIFAFEKRFSLLASGTSLNSNQIPIGPYVIVNSFALSIKKLDLEVNIKLIMYKLFERTVMGQLNGVYNHINDYLAQKGIIPEIVYNIGNLNQTGLLSTAVQSQTPQPIDQQPAQQNNTPNHAVQTNSSAISQQYVDPNYQLISQLFKQNHEQPNSSQENHSINNPAINNSGQTTGVPVQPVVANIDMMSMMNALSILQGDMFKNVQIDQQSKKSPTEIKDELIKQLHKLDGETKDQKVKQKDEDTIDLVGMLFQFIVDDRNLPDAIQVILSKLQIPYLKIALQDRHLFADKSHPARALLDKLSQASVGWTEESDNKNLFISKIQQIVKYLLETDEYDPKTYTILKTNFNKFLLKQKKKSDVVQRRTKEKSLGQDKINQAKEESAKLLVEKMTNKQMPILVRDILLGEWSNVLILMFLRHSEDSKEYKEKVDFVNKVVLYSQVDKYPVTKDHINDLSDDYAKGLKLVAFNSKELFDKQHALVNCISGIHQLDTDEAIDISNVELIDSKEVLKLSEIRKQKHDIVNYIEEIIEPTDNEEKYEHIDDEFSKIISSLKTGTWLEFSKGNNNAVRAKLSWISPITGKYLFVNSRGLKITDKTDLALSAGLRDKSIRVLQQVALFDRALSAIANKLKKDDTPNENAVKKDVVKKNDDDDE